MNTLERPHDPYGREEIWRRAKKKYKRDYQSLNMLKPGVSEDLIRKEVVSLGIEALAKKKIVPTAPALSELLGLSYGTIRYILKKYRALRVKSIEVTRRLKRSDILEAGLGVLAEGKDITTRSLAQASGIGPSTQWEQLNKDLELKELLGIGRAPKFASGESLESRLRMAVEHILSQSRNHKVSPSTLARVVKRPVGIIESFLLNNKNIAEDILDEDEFKKLFP